MDLSQAAPRPSTLRWPLRRHLPHWLLGLSLFIGAAIWSETLSGQSISPQAPIETIPTSDFSVLPFNVKGLPWPVAWGRDEALLTIGQRLAQMREQKREPSVVLLQEAFTPQAKQIGRQAGYRFRVSGPALRDQRAGDGKWYLGETEGTPLDSGLVVLSDYPVNRVIRAAFPAGSCAGFDCLAAKGALLVGLELPDGGKVDVLDTHLNSRAASHAPAAQSDAAFARESRFLARFVRLNHDPKVPLVMAGDFNMGERPKREAALLGGIRSLPGAHGTVREALSGLMGAGDSSLLQSADARMIHHRARDMQFMLDGASEAIRAVGADIPFGTEPDGSSLSDHLALTTYYRLSRS